MHAPSEDAHRITQFLSWVDSLTALDWASVEAAGGAAEYEDARSAAYRAFAEMHGDEQDRIVAAAQRVANRFGGVARTGTSIAGDRQARYTLQVVLTMLLALCVRHDALSGDEAGRLSAPMRHLAPPERLG